MTSTSTGTHTPDVLSDSNPARGFTTLWPHGDEARFAPMIPLNTDRPLKNPSVVTPALIVINLLVALGFAVAGDQADDLWKQLELRPSDPRLWQFVTYQFLHAGMLHLLGNMLFLWVFGQSVEDRLGRAAFVAFYLTGGVLAGIAHVLTEPVAGVVGASGAIAAVTGAFLALFPYTRIRILWIFLVIGVFEIPSLWFLGFSFARDVISQFRGDGGVAYSAHVAGNLFGCAVGLGLLSLRLLPREPYDLFTLVSHWYRRRRFRRIAHRGYDPWLGVRRGKPSAWRKSFGRDRDTDSERPPRQQMTQNNGESAGASAGSGDPVSSTAAATGDAPALARVDSPDGTPDPEARGSFSADDAASPELVNDPSYAARDAVSQLIESGKYEEATAAYLRLISEYPQAILGRQALLDVANTLFRSGRHAQAADAYERYLTAYPTEDSKGQVRLVYGLLLVRYLGRPMDAHAPLREALGRLHQQSDTDLATALLRESGYTNPTEGQ